MSLSRFHCLSVLLHKIAVHPSAQHGPAAALVGQRLLEQQHQYPPSFPGWHDFRAAVFHQARTYSQGAAKAAGSQSEAPSLVKVVLLQDVVGLGQEGDVASANPGWVRHSLFPSGAVVYATPDNIKHFAMAEEERLKKSSPQDMERENMTKILLKLSRETVKISRKKVAAADGGPDKIVGSVTPYDIQSTVARQLGIRLHDSHFMMNEPITDFGIFKVPLNLRGLNDVQIELTVQVNAVTHLRHGSTSC